MNTKAKKHEPHRSCPLRRIPTVVRVQLRNIDNLFDRICSGLAWVG
jgi:hypothetical protein